MWLSRRTIYERHELATRKQKMGESLDEYLEELKKLAKNCNFLAVTAENYRFKMTRLSMGCHQAASSDNVCLKIQHYLFMRHMRKPVLLIWLKEFRCIFSTT